MYEYPATDNPGRRLASAFGMNRIPAPAENYLLDLALGERPVACLELDRHGLLLSRYGDLDVFGIGRLQPGAAAVDELDFLTGLVDHEGLPIELNFIQMPSGVSSDLHLFSDEDRFWVLLIGVEEKFVQQQSVQQKVKELNLTHQHQTRIIDQYLGKEVARRLEFGIENIAQAGERRNLTVMFADIRGFTSFSEKSQPEEVFEALNIYLGAMIPAVIDENGVIDKIIGDEVMAIFGMLPEHTDGPACGLRAALKILAEIERLNRQRREQGVDLLQIGIGMATGPVSLGVLGSQDRKSLTVIGNHVNLAARLQGIAGPNQLVVDRSSYDALGAWHDRFHRHSAELKGFSAAIDTFLLELNATPDAALR